MAIEKYGVSDVAAQQEQELRETKARLRALRADHEKTATETQEIERLETRESEITAALAEH